MQHRRHLAFDNKGVFEPLDERDVDDNGIRVKANYWMEILDRNVKKSVSRVH